MSAPKAQRTMTGQKTTNNGEAAVLPDNKTVYILPNRTSDNIVDLVLKIMDAEGPRPMRNLRPAQKTRNGADKFYVEHHAEYEARGQQSRDHIGRVTKHNSAFPKMYDELNKRHSTAKPAAYNTANHNVAPTTIFDPNCKICVRLKKQAELDRQKKNNSTKPRYQRKYYGTRSKFRDNRTKITKTRRPQRRYRSPSRIYKLSKIRMNKGCQCTCYYIPAETKSVSTFNDNFVPIPPPQQDVKPAANIYGSNEHYETKRISSPTHGQATKDPIKKPSKSDIDSGNPETNSARSLSTYNSYMSMDHEPMVE